MGRLGRMEKGNKSLGTERWENNDALYINKYYYYYYYYYCFVLYSLFFTWLHSEYIVPLWVSVVLLLNLVISTALYLITKYVVFLHDLSKFRFYYPYNVFFYFLPVTLFKIQSNFLTAVHCIDSERWLDLIFHTSTFIILFYFF